jgi:transposase
MTERRATAITNNKARELKRFLRRRHRPEVERRLQAVLSVLWGHRTADVATRYDVTDRAVRQWVQRFNISGPSALMRSRGRKPRWTKAQREELRLALIDVKSRWGKLEWRRVQNTICEKTGIVLSPSSLHHFAKQLRLQIGTRRQRPSRSSTT